MLSSRLHRRPRSWLTFLCFALLAALPDIDVFWVALGVPDVGALGHRGFTHTPVFAVALGLIAALARRGPARWRLGLAVMMAVGSHGVLDALAEGGRGIMFLWPFSGRRFSFDWRPIPDAPAGLGFFSRIGFHHLLIELLLFFPLTILALWPRRRRHF